MAHPSPFRVPTRPASRPSVLPLATVLTLVLLALLPSGCARTSQDRGDAPALDEIRGASLEANLRFLASDQFEGRAPSTRGGALAAEFLASQLAALGFSPAGDGGGWFQQVPLVTTTLRPGLTLAVGGERLRMPDDLIAFSGRTDARVPVNGELVFVGYGIVAPEEQWDDYAGVDVTGRVVLVMVNEPQPTPAEPSRFGGDALTCYGRWTYKFEEAARHGAAGAILIHTDASATYGWSVVQSSWGGVQYTLPVQPGAPALALKAWVTDGAAGRVVRSAGHDLDRLRAAADTRGAHPTPLGVSVSGELLQDVASRPAPNVIGVWPGTGDGAVLYTAHYDHLGVRESSTGGPDAPGVAADPRIDHVYNGALDNASGVAGTLEIARAIARAPVRPRRSVYVLFTTAEEHGLLGSEWFAAHLPRPVADWAAAINVDELNLFGRTRDLALLGAERSTIGDVARRVAAAQHRTISGDPDPGRGFFFRSDHFPLAQAGIPAVSIALPDTFEGTDAEAARQRAQRFERDYHELGDEVQDDWRYDAAVDDLRLLAGLGWALATDDATPTWLPGQPFARPGRAAASAR